MNGIKKTDTEVTISDLKNLGRQGGVTARLDSGEVVTLKAKYATRTRKAIVAGQETEVEIIVYYADIYKQIRTIKRKNLVIARKVKQNNQTILQLTGKGYHRS
ncbi:hypothetical protein MP619_06690 [Streptococcus dysgalactiae]|uniref:Uncharacterized protein n=1 Tax=Streptococcus dysgalactiae TaxID=1334 RepID=A0AAE9UKE5_STRDY|nr:hypothetical protein [Streptococcus dysgalactiae]WAI92208.1 hypothetical protein MP619_06690 [Streptococcus dysgalactiae]WHL22683.1 hypothetical protein QLH62_06585 [Streptococcus iniae]